jgi:hypothetical protein
VRYLFLQKSAIILGDFLKWINIRFSIKFLRLNNLVTEAIMDTSLTQSVVGLLQNNLPYAVTIACSWMKATERHL